MEKIIIASLSNNGVIGNNGQTPWHISQDLERFRKLTLGNSVIMGRKTYESIGKPLDGRLNIVITRKGKFKSKEPLGIVVCHSVEEALKKAERYGEKVYIAGGGEIYRQTLSLADRLELTRIHRFVNGDAYFPQIDWNEWEEVYKDDHNDYSFHAYERIKGE